MGRVFTIMFEFQDEQHIAMVTLCEDHQVPAPFQVQLFNQELYHLIPDGKFVFTATDNQLPAFIRSRAAAELFQSIKTAIYNHLTPRPTTADEEIISEANHDSNTGT